MLVLVRHGRTALNAAGRLQGRVDVDLDDTGRAQAAAVAELVSGADRVVSSPLRRARQTAAAFGRPVDVDDRWIEVDYGEHDGRPLAEVPADMWDRWRRDASFRPPGGESLADVGRRVRAACEDLAGEAVRHDVVVVTHVSPIKAAVAWAVGAGDLAAWRLFVDVASLHRIAITDRGPVLRSFNEVAPLRSP